MQIVLIILTSALISGLLLFSFYEGYKLGKTHVIPEKNELEVNEHNVNTIKALYEWMGYYGKRGRYEDKQETK